MKYGSTVGVQGNFNARGWTHTQDALIQLRAQVINLSDAATGRSVANLSLNDVLNAKSFSVAS